MDFGECVHFWRLSPQSIWRVTGKIGRRFFLQMWVLAGIVKNCRLLAFAIFAHDWPLLTFEPFLFSTISLWKSLKCHPFSSSLIFTYSTSKYKTLEKSICNKAWWNLKTGGISFQFSRRRRLRKYLRFGKKVFFISNIKGISFIHF
jgi:hypothetical protein